MLVRGGELRVSLFQYLRTPPKASFLTLGGRALTGFRAGSNCFSWDFQSCFQPRLPPDFKSYLVTSSLAFLRLFGSDELPLLRVSPAAGLDISYAWLIQLSVCPTFLDFDAVISCLCVCFLSSSLFVF